MLDRRIEETVAGLQRSVGNNVRSIGEANAATIVEYIAAMKSEVNLSNNYRKDIIEVLCRLSGYNGNRPFRVLTRADVLAFLVTFRKTETQDPMHKWIGPTTLLGSICSDFSNGYTILISDLTKGLNLQ